MTRSERIEGPTPAGGAYAIAYVGDDRRGEIVEFNAEGNQLARTYATFRFSWLEGDELSATVPEESGNDLTGDPAGSAGELTRRLAG